MNRPRIAVIGSGVAGLSSAWLLSGSCDVTVFEAGAHAGGHSNTRIASLPEGPVAVDTGFIVYNELNYPNLTALFAHLDVETVASNMSFSYSLDQGRYEYCGTGLKGLFGQRSNVVNFTHWRLLKDIQRFFAEARLKVAAYGDDVSIGDFLVAEGYSRTFIEDHILPMSSAIWSSPAGIMQSMPARSFLEFYANHGLLQRIDRPKWRTVRGGSRNYVKRLVEDGGFEVLVERPVAAIDRFATHVVVTEENGVSHRFDEVVLACHADMALKILRGGNAEEKRILGNFDYTDNRAVLHSDARFMPRRRRLWSSWNYANQRRGESSVTYWMNRLQQLETSTDLFVTINPERPVDPASIVYETSYRHPVLDARAVRAQEELWTLQGANRTWFCGSYFGYGFHEDALQSGLAVAEELGGVRRPWNVENESGRIQRRQAFIQEAAE